MLVSLNAFLLTEVVVGVNGEADGLGEGEGEAEGAADWLALGVGLPTADVPGPAHAVSTRTDRRAPIDLTTRG